MTQKGTEINKILYPYAERYGTVDEFPEGFDRTKILQQIKDMATEEDARWSGGYCSGTMYGGDQDIFGFIADVFRHYSHVNALQRDICPSQTRFEAEIINMTLDLFNGKAVAEHNPEQKACGVMSTGGTDSIISAILAYRDKFREEKNITQPEMILPDTAHSAFHKGAHYFGVKVVSAPMNPQTTQVDIDFVRNNINQNTILLVGSAGNYPYGTIDPIDQLSDLAVENDIGLHVDGCLGGFILPWGEKLGYDIPVFDYRLPGVTSISADTHKYAYGPKGSSVVTYRDKTYRKYQYFTQPEWKGGMYTSPGLGGSRSGGIIAATWAVMVTIGSKGYLERAKRIFEASYTMQEAVKSHPELRMMGTPTFNFSFTSDEFDIYHINDFMVGRGWRLNGQQYPGALHMCVTGPQTQPGLVEKFIKDLKDAVPYAKNPPQDMPSSRALYGGQIIRGAEENIGSKQIRELLFSLQDLRLEQPSFKK